MNILLIEDEPQAALRLEKLMLSIIPNAVLLSKLDTVKSSVQWLTTHPSPDLIFLDIQLGDGISFSIFDQVDVQAPVIFTTAYDEYALKAFKVNSIDYLLKPIDEENLRLALKKYESLTTAHSLNANKMMESVRLAMQMISKKYKERFVIKVGEHLRSVEVNEIVCFYSLEKTTFAQTKEGRKHILDFTLDQLVELLNPNRYFRINRKYIVAVDAIQDMISYTNSRIKLVLKDFDDEEIIVARERVQEFKDWLDQ